MWDKVASAWDRATSNDSAWMRIRGDPAISGANHAHVRCCDSAYDACVRKRPAVLALVFAAPLLACGALLGSGSDDIEPPIRDTDAGGGSRGEAGDEESGTDASADANDSSSDDASGDAMADAKVDTAAPRQKVVFVTSQRFTGGFGTRADADTACTFAAKQANMALFGSSTFKAYLAAGNGVAASARITDRVYVGIDGTKVFDPGPQTNPNPSGLIVFDETGTNLSNATNKFVWTGNATGSAAADRTCVDWSSSAGNKFGGFGDMHTTTNWAEMSGQTAGCDSQFRLYCFED